MLILALQYGNNLLCSILRSKFILSILSVTKLFRSIWVSPWFSAFEIVIPLHFIYFYHKSYWCRAESVLSLKSGLDLYWHTAKQWVRCEIIKWIDIKSNTGSLLKQSIQYTVLQSLYPKESFYLIFNFIIPASVYSRFIRLDINSLYCDIEAEVRWNGQHLSWQSTVRIGNS